MLDFNEIGYRTETTPATTETGLSLEFSDTELNV